MKKRIIFHIGMPKTGTTFLQNNVFPYFKDINYIKCVGVVKGTDRIRLNPFYLKFEEGTNLISDERICGFGYLNLPYGTALDRLKVLKKVYPNAEIIMVTRELEPFLKSLYKQYARHSYGVLDFAYWIMEELDISLIHQDIVVKYIKRHFKNSLILEYEELVNAPLRFINKITSFLDIQHICHYDREWVNVSPSDESIGAILKINRSHLPDCLKMALRYFWRQNHD